jgi:hypothetical protein
VGRSSCTSPAVITLRLFPFIKRMISWPDVKTRAGPMESFRHTKFLLVAIIVLGSICFGRLVWLEQPIAAIFGDPPEHSSDWVPPPLQ